MDRVLLLTGTAAVIGALIAALKTDWFQSKFHIPKSYFPWIALGLGMVGALVQVSLHPEADIQTYLKDVFEGAMSGLAPVAVHELSTNRDAS